MKDLQLLIKLPCKNQLGEGVQWNAADQAFWWTDIHGLGLHRFHVESLTHTRWSVPEKIASFCFSKTNRLLAAFSSGFAWFDPITGERENIAVAETLDGNRSNDGRVDRQGRFWMGTIVESPVTPEQSASLYCLDQTFAVSSHLTSLKISNALCWSPDGKTLYHADSPTHQIRAFDFDTDAGNLSNPRIFIQTEQGVEPDGACVDSEGFMWNAQWGGSRVRRYTASGELDLELTVPVTQPTCICFGGEDYSLLAVTSARVGLTASQLSEQPDAGALFIYKTPFTGLPESQFASN